MTSQKKNCIQKSSEFNFHGDRQSLKWLLCGPLVPALAQTRNFQGCFLMVLEGFLAMIEEICGKDPESFRMAYRLILKYFWPVSCAFGLFRQMWFFSDCLVYFVLHNSSSCFKYILKKTMQLKFEGSTH